MKFCKTLDFCLIYQGRVFFFFLRDYQGRVKLDGYELIYLFQPIQDRDAQCFGSLR